MRGALIVFEGCDQAGKTTQLRKLAAGLLKENIPNEIVAFPSRTQILQDFYSTEFLSLIKLFFSVH